MELTYDQLLALMREGGFAVFSFYLLWRIDRRLAELGADLRAIIDKMPRA